jgi:hypothetical protein
VGNDSLYLLPRRQVRWCPGPLDQELAEGITPIPTFPRDSQIPSRLILSGMGSVEGLRNTADGVPQAQCGEKCIEGSVAFSVFRMTFRSTRARAAGQRADQPLRSTKQRSTQRQDQTLRGSDRI